MRERAANQGSRRERGQNEGGGNTGAKEAENAGVLAYGRLAPYMAEAGKTTENRPLHRQNWVRIINHGQRPWY